MALQIVNPEICLGKSRLLLLHNFHITTHAYPFSRRWGSLKKQRFPPVRKHVETSPFQKLALNCFLMTFFMFFYTLKTFPIKLAHTNVQLQLHLPTHRSNSTSERKSKAARRCPSTLTKSLTIGQYTLFFNTGLVGDTH